jgi:hypothetical protein
MHADEQAAFELFVLNEKPTSQKPLLTLINPEKEYVIEKEVICDGCKAPKIYCRCKHKKDKATQTIQEIMKKCNLKI